VLDLWTVDQMAEALAMHPRTVRRYIREGRLKAHKVGGEWRIRREDAEEFTGGMVDDLHDRALGELKQFLSGMNDEPMGGIQVCSVVDCPADSMEGPARISELLVRQMNAAGDGVKAKFQYFYIAERRIGRFILRGSPEWVGKLLQMIGEVTV